MVGYELPLGMAVAAPLLMAGSLSLREIVLSQGTFYGGFLPGWNLFRMPFPQVISFFVFMIAAFAETNRIPFDLPEAENELVAGFHTEYSSLKFACFFMAEYANMITVCCMATVLFLGGWLPPWPAEYGSNYLPSAGLLLCGALFLYHGLPPAFRRDRLTLPAAGIAAILAAGVLLIPAVQELAMPLVWFLAKTGFLLLVFIWVRGTLPRLRYDQLMRFTWTFLFPVGVLNLMATGLVVALRS
jgi:NADH-quinone oxidoreductase subunit H